MDVRNTERCKEEEENLFEMKIVEKFDLEIIFFFFFCLSFPVVAEQYWIEALNFLYLCKE